MLDKESYTADEVQELIDKSVKGRVDSIKKTHSEELESLKADNEKLKTELDDFKKSKLSDKELRNFKYDQLKEQFDGVNSELSNLKAEKAKNDRVSLIKERAGQDKITLSDDVINNLIVTEDDDTTLAKYEAYKAQSKALEDSYKQKYSRGIVPQSNLHTGSDDNDYNYGSNLYKKNHK